MKKTFFILSGLMLPVLATEMPPIIPVGPIAYDDVSYGAETMPPANETLPAMNEPAAQGGGIYAEPVTPAASSEKRWELGANLYTSNYNVRGMGVTNALSDYGWSSVSASFTFPNRNLLNKGIYAKAGGDFGIIWDAADALGDTPKFDLGGTIGKEIFPNLTLEAGYTLHRGGLEGYMARFHGRTAHRVAQDLNLTLSFNDRQRGFFGHLTWGYGFQGLTGHFFDMEAGYRFTDVLRDARANADVEISGGLAPSLGYWGAGVEGMDAYRIKVALLPYTPDGKLGRDGAWMLKPWVQCAWSGCNTRKIDRVTGYGPVDHFQITFGVEGGWRF